ncbi:SRPBCC family protein [Phycicoccus sp. 3266]|uniref:SRPBCC family protein n=1 Tax=Phycicoccus sp. 3266 TaxID=2817751 RepID=UPI002854CF1F|nr:SRPBCC family protein [Phycicoccus sp. 3266]MDR6864255.1 putative membrane protein [Phycicoccus sp. 3266]
MTRIVTESIDVAAPAETVFAILADPRQHARIDGSGSVQAIVEGPERLERGSQFGAQMRLFGLPYRISNRVVEFEEGHRIAWRHFGGHRWRYELEPLGADRTRVTESFDYSMYGTGPRLVIELLRFPARNRDGIRATLVRLRDAAEADAATGTSVDAATGEGS